MPPRSATALQLFKIAQMIAGSLYRITVTDPWYKEKGGNWTEPTLENQTSSMGGLFSAINARRTGENESQTVGLRSVGLNQRRRHVVSMSAEDWLRQGQKTVEAGHGVCTDCAAAAAYAFSKKVPDDIEFRLEIISSGTHAFTIVNRDHASDVTDPPGWGDDAFGIDIWMQNQFPRGKVGGAFWTSDKGHSVGNFIHTNAHRLNVDATLRAEIQPLF